MWVPPGFQMDRERAEVSPHPSGVVVWGRWAVFVCSGFSLHPFQTWEVTEVPRGRGMLHCQNTSLSTERKK